jgi:hypothetical protein
LINTNAEKGKMSYIQHSCIEEHKNKLQEINKCGQGHIKEEKIKKMFHNIQLKIFEELYFSFNKNKQTQKKPTISLCLLASLKKFFYSL